EQVGHVIGGGSPGRVVIYSDKGIIPLTDSRDHMDERNASGIHLAQTGLDLRMIGRDDDQSGPTKAWAGDVSGNAHWIKFVQKSAVDNDAGIEGRGKARKGFAQPGKERRIRAHHDDLNSDDPVITLR